MPKIIKIRGKSKGKEDKKTKRTQKITIDIKKRPKNLVGRKKSINFALANGRRHQRKSRANDSVDQLVEQMTLNHWVVGSSPTGVTKPNGKIKQIAETKTVSAIFVMSLSGRIKHIVGLRGVQFVNSRNREQFVHDVISSKRHFLIFCIFL